MKVLILAGGAGTRAYPYTEYLPKPMLPVGGKPILLHVMELYARQGFDKFVLSVGHRKETIVDYFHQRNLGWSVEIVDTGNDADTGDRIWRCRDLLQDTFMATYADGLSDVPLRDLLHFHRRNAAMATITCVPLRSQYGTVETGADNRVVGFQEKPLLAEHWINAGFFVMEPTIFDAWEGGNLEREVFPNLLEGRNLASFRHHGFFKSLDTYKDQQEFESLITRGSFPWLQRETLTT